MQVWTPSRKLVAEQIQVASVTEHPVLPMALRAQVVYVLMSVGGCWLTRKMVGKRTYCTWWQGGCLRRRQVEQRQETESGGSKGTHGGGRMRVLLGIQTRDCVEYRVYRHDR